MNQPDAEQTVPDCSECTKYPGTIRKMRKYFCPDCWIHHCNFRFRKRLYELGKIVKSSTRSCQNQSGTSKSDVFGPPEHVLIYYDCSPWAKALLSLVRDTILANLALESSPETERHRTFPPFPFVFTVLFIHEGANEYGALDVNTNINPGNETRMNSLKELRSWLSESKSTFGLDFPLVVSSLEKSLSSSNSTSTPVKEEMKNTKQEEWWREIQRTETDSDVSLYLPFDPDLNTRLVMLVDNIKTTSSRLDFLQCLRQNLIVSVTRGLNLSKVLLPDQQTTMSVKMFSMMSLGRGAQVSDQMSLTTKVDVVELTRPLMDLSSDDLFDYLSSLDKSSRTTRVTTENKEKRIDSIRSQCEDFIVTLQTDFPSTVPTLTKIGAKLDGNCPSSTALQASKCLLCKQRLDQEGTETIDFCYGCSNILKEMKDASILRGILATLKK